MDFVPVVVVMVAEELERLKILLVLTYSGTEGNSLTPHKVPGDTQCCPDTQLLVTVLQKQPEMLARSCPGLLEMQQDAMDRNVSQQDILGVSLLMALVCRPKD